MRDTLKLHAILGCGVVSALVFEVWILFNRVGPRIMWSSDLCPDPTVTCGVMPLGAILSVIVGAGVVFVLSHVALRIDPPDGETA